VHRHLAVHDGGIGLAADELGQFSSATFGRGVPASAGRGRGSRPVRFSCIVEEHTGIWAESAGPASAPSCLSCSYMVRQLKPDLSVVEKGTRLGSSSSHVGADAVRTTRDRARQYILPSHMAIRR